MKIRVFVLFLALHAALITTAQTTQIYVQPDAKYATALQLYNKGHYGAAQKIFESFATSQGYETTIYNDDAKYYVSMCALKLFNKDAEYLITRFIREHPESYNVNDANFQMANYQFLKKSYPKALKWYEKVDRLNLNAAENSEYFFKMGYCHFARKDYDKAAKSFYEIKDSETFYGPLSEYFYSHIKYMNGQYQTALLGFQKIEKHDWFADIVPFYITQIYYLQDKYAEIIDYAPGLLVKSESDRWSEVSRIIGEAYYRTEKYAEAIPYFEKGFGSDRDIMETDAYQLAYSYYRSGQYNKAIPYFEGTMRGNDTLVQNAAYHLADCYLRADRKKDAKNAFGTAARYKTNPSIREDALFNFAKISYELDYSPFNEALNAFNTFLNEFPNSDRVDEAYDYMLQAFLTTKNYQDALNIMDKMKTKPPKIEQAYQRIAYLRGLEHFIDQRFDQSISFFDKSLKYGHYDSQIKALCNYWKGEAFFRQEKYDNAINQFKQFTETPGAVSIDEFATAHYNLGYAYFKKKDYQNAGNWFRKFEKAYTGEPDKIYNDAMNRIGDCFFISKQFEQATDYYKKSALLGFYDSDYAMYQMAMGYGGQKKHQEKIWSLTKLVRDFPSSSYAGFANFEIARTYNTMLHKPDSAVMYYKTVINNYQGAIMVKTALSDLATIYFNQKKYNDALETYKQLIALFPNSDEARAAKEMIRNIYIEMNDTDAYVEYANSQGDIVVSVTEQDSLMFLSAQKLYANQEYSKALESLNKYLEKFPRGGYNIDAHFYKAELLNYFGKPDEALPSYETVAKAPAGMYTEESILKSATILYTNKSYQSALDYYVRLEKISQNKNNILISRHGQLRCNYILEKWNDVISSAQKLINTDKVSEEMIKEARYNEAKARYHQEQWMQAYNLFSSLATEVKSTEGAEARYRMAEIQLKIGQDSLAESMIYEFAQMSSPHRYWLAKSFMLLSDIFLGRNDLFQAKHTLKSILDNYTDETDGIKDEAFNKLAEITEMEKAEEQTNKFLKMEINTGNDNSGYDKLIDGSDNENNENE